MGRGSLPAAPPRTPAPPLGARPRRRRAGAQPGTVLGTEAGLLEAAAWLHDIGYVPDLAVTDLHAFDGARYLRDAHQADALLCRLVAHHSYAIVEAEERGLANILASSWSLTMRALQRADLL